MRTGKKTVALMHLAWLVIAASLVPSCGPSERMGSAKGKEKEAQVLALLPLTGSAASYGQSCKEGIDLFLKTTNKPAIGVQIEDTQGNPQTGVSLMQQAALSEKPYAVISSLSGVSAAVIPKAEELDVFSILTMTASDKIIKGRSKVQRVSLSAKNFISPVAEYALAKHKTLSILYTNEDLGIALRDVFAQVYANSEHTILVSEAYDVKTSDVRSLVLKATAPNPSAVVVVGWGPAYIGIFKTLREIGFPGEVLADADFSDPSVFKALGDAAEGVVFVGTAVEQDSGRSKPIEDFAADYERQFGKRPFWPALIGYESAAIIDHMARAGKQMTRQSLSDLGEWNGVSGKIGFLPDGECDFPTHLLRRQSGQNLRVDSQA